jgi:hypothetical protein
MDYRKVDLQQVEQNLVERLRNQGRGKVMDQFYQLQTAVYVMCGGGHLGSFAAGQPHNFYIDSRMGKLPYSKRAIMQTVAVLALYVKVLDLDKDKLPQNWMDAHNCGVF